MTDYRELHKLKELLVETILKIEKYELPGHGRTRLKVTDVVAKPGHHNDKGIYINGEVIIAVQVNYGNYEWKKAYRIMQSEIDQFTFDEFKKRIYQESRIWIKEKDLEVDVLGKLKGTQNKTVYLD